VRHERKSQRFIIRLGQLVRSAPSDLSFAGLGLLRRAQAARASAFACCEIRRKAMTSKSILGAFAIAATVAVVSPASDEYLETGTAANDSESGFGGSYAWTVPHSEQVLINHWPDHQRRQ
jgi:hypothetical protein